MAKSFKIGFWFGFICVIINTAGVYFLSDKIGVLEMYGITVGMYTVWSILFTAIFGTFCGVLYGFTFYGITCAFTVWKMHRRQKAEALEGWGNIIA